MTDRPDDLHPDAEILYDVTLEEGKYRFIYLANGAPKAYRHGEPWTPFTNKMLGSNAIYAMVAALAESQAIQKAADANRETSDEIASMAGRILSAGNPLENDQVIAVIAQDLPLAADPEEVVEALTPILGPYFDNMLSLAGSCLSQKED